MHVIQRIVETENPTFHDWVNCGFGVLQRLMVSGAHGLEQTFLLSVDCPLIHIPTEYDGTDAGKWHTKTSGDLCTFCFCKLGIVRHLPGSGSCCS